MEVLTDFPERLKTGLVVWVGDAHRRLIARRCKPLGEGMLIAFEGLSSPEVARDLRNQFVYVKTDELPDLPSGEFYHHQLIGLQVVSPLGEDYGHIVEILSTGANDVYVVRPATGREILIPAMASVVKEINLVEEKITVELLPGTLPD